MYRNLMAKPRLHAILEERGMSMEELSEKATVPLSRIKFFDRFYKHDAVSLVRIAKALDLHVEDLYEVKEDAEAARQRIPGWPSSYSAKA